MEVLLLQDIPGIGKKNDLLVVGDGFALNNLLPYRKALVATPTVRRRYAEQIRRRAEEKLREQEFKKSAAAAIAGKEVTFLRKATKTGKLYAAITEKHLAEALKEQHSIEVKPEQILIAEPIKTLGSFTVKVKVAEQEQPFTVKVEQGEAKK